MATGACGINCDVCKLNIEGVCSTCGSGNCLNGEIKAKTQEKLFSASCPILSCAKMNKINYCMRDCKVFPCENFDKMDYPYSKSFLKMQKRRRSDKKQPKSSYGFDLDVPSQYWEELEKKNIKQVCGLSGAKQESPDALSIRFLAEELRINKKEKSLKKKMSTNWETVRDPLLELLILVYLLNVKEHTIENKMVSVKDLKTSHFFQGPHALRLEPLISRFGYKPESFLNAGEALGGIPVKKADASFCLMALPKIPVYYMLWAGDNDFPPSLSILFDRSIENHLSADAIWGLTTLVSDALIKV